MGCGSSAAADTSSERYRGRHGTRIALPRKSWRVRRLTQLANVDEWPLILLNRSLGGVHLYPQYVVRTRGTDGLAAVLDGRSVLRRTPPPSADTGDTWLVHLRDAHFAPVSLNVDAAEFEYLVTSKISDVNDVPQIVNETPLKRAVQGKQDHSFVLLYREDSTPEFSEFHDPCAYQAQHDREIEMVQDAMNSHMRRIVLPRLVPCRWKRYEVRAVASYESPIISLSLSGDERSIAVATSMRKWDEACVEGWKLAPHELTGAPMVEMVAFEDLSASVQTSGGSAAMLHASGRRSTQGAWEDAPAGGDALPEGPVVACGSPCARTLRSPHANLAITIKSVSDLGSLRGSVDNTPTSPLQNYTPAAPDAYAGLESPKRGRQLWNALSQTVSRTRALRERWLAVRQEVEAVSRRRMAWRTVIKEYSFVTGGESRIFRERDGPQCNYASLYVGDELLTVSRCGVRTWVKGRSNPWRKKSLAKLDVVHTLALSRDGLVMAAAGSFVDKSRPVSKGAVYIFERGVYESRYVYHRAPVTCVVIADDNKFAASGDAAGYIHVWRLADTTPTTVIRAAEPILAVLFPFPWATTVVSLTATAVTRYEVDGKYTSPGVIGVYIFGRTSLVVAPYSVAWAMQPEIVPSSSDVVQYRAAALVPGGHIALMQTTLDIIFITPEGTVFACVRLSAVPTCIAAGRAGLYIGDINGNVHSVDIETNDMLPIM